MGISIFIAAMAGGAGDGYVSNQILLFIFADLAFGAAFLMLMAVPIGLTVVPAAHVGSLVSRRVPVSGLRRALAVLIALAEIRIWLSVLFG